MPDNMINVQHKSDKKFRFANTFITGNHRKDKRKEKKRKGKLGNDAYNNIKFKISTTQK